MLAEIIRKYESFGDAQILKIQYEMPLSDFKAKVVLQILCMNKENGWKLETINLVLIDVIKFKFIQHEGRMSSTSIFAALLKQTKDRIILDFFAVQENGEGVEEDPKSDFVIHCKKVTYEVVQQ